MQEQNGTPQSVRSAYRKPHLVRYGKLASLIEGGSNGAPTETSSIVISALG